MKYVVYTSIRSYHGIDLHRPIAEFKTHKEAEDFVFVERAAHQKQKYFKDMYIVEEKSIEVVDVKKKTRKTPNVGS